MRAEPRAAGVSGVTLHYKEWGAVPPGDSQELLLLVHGAGGSGHHWRWLMEEMPRRVNAIAPDLPGHGFSSGQVPSSVDEAAAVLDDFLASLDAPPRVAVVAHSIGGMVAQAYALAHPERLSHLVLIASGGHMPPHPQFLEQLLAGRLDEDVIRAGFQPGVPEERQRVVVDDWRRVRIAPGATDFLGAGSSGLTQRVPGLAVPTLVVAARRDVILSPRKTRALASQVPGARLIELDAGHYLHIERPRDVADAITEFVRPAAAVPTAER